MIEPCDDWYSISTDKIVIQDNYKPDKQNDCKNCDYIKLLEEKLANILNEQRENQEEIEKRIISLEQRLNNEILSLKNDLLKKTIELERSNNALIRHKISFPFSAQQHDTLFSFLKL